MGIIIRKNFAVGVTMARMYVAEKEIHIHGRRKAKLI